MKNILWPTAISFFFLLPVAAHAQLSLTTGLDYSSGKYGGTRTTTAVEVPVMLKYEAAPWTFTAYIPYLDVDGVTNVNTGGTVATVDENQSGIGDTVIGGTYELLPRGGTYGIDIGLKTKLVTADRDNDLLTTGNPDYTVQSNFYTLLGRGTFLATLGWTVKGDIRVVDTDGQFYTLNPDNPLSFSLAYSQPVNPRTQLGIAYDWRQKLFSDTDDISEISLLLSYRYTAHWRLHSYLLTGLSDASPDTGAGVFLNYSW